MSDFSGPPTLPDGIFSDSAEDETLPLGDVAPPGGLSPFGPVGGGAFGSGTVDPYFPGDELQPAGWSPERVGDLQKQMSKAGILNPKNIDEFGVFDTSTQTAYKGLLTQSNRAGTDWISTLRRLSSMTAAERLKAKEAASAGGGGRAPTIRVSNPDDLRSIFRQTARAVTGGVFVEDDQIENMIRAYQGEEASFQQAALGGGTIEGAPSPQAFAEAQLEEINPGGATANRFSQMAQTLESLVGEARAV